MKTNINTEQYGTRLLNLLFIFKILKTSLYNTYILIQKKYKEKAKLGDF